MANALAASSSPYLRQHADNPVDWVPWSDAALAQAQELDRPLLISIGYSACHWCHVMAHESFEDPEIAAFMNAHFVCVKVDREERPDVDAIYMDACQMLTGHGGWPLHAFATPDGRRSSRHVLPSGGEPRHAVVAAGAGGPRGRVVGATRRDRGAGIGARRAAGRRSAAEPEALPGPDALDAAVAGLRQRFDSVNGGFGMPRSSRRRPRSAS